MYVESNIFDLQDRLQFGAAPAHAALDEGHGESLDRTRLGIQRIYSTYPIYRRNKLRCGACGAMAMWPPLKSCSCRRVERQPSVFLQIGVSHGSSFLPSPIASCLGR